MTTIQCDLHIFNIYKNTRIVESAAVTWFDGGRAILRDGRHARLLGYERGGEIVPDPDVTGDPVFNGLGVVELRIARADWQKLAEAAGHTGPLPSYDPGGPSLVYTRRSEDGRCSICTIGFVERLMSGSGIHPDFLICWRCQSVIQCEVGYVPLVDQR